VAKTNEDAFQATVARAVLRDIRHTPQKARRVINLVRGMKADQALAVLKFAPQAAGQDIYALLNSAVANAKQKNSGSSKQLSMKAPQ
jgi:large subunit ribosomal protein L22